MQFIKNNPLLLVALAIGLIAGYMVGEWRGSREANARIEAMNKTTKFSGPVDCTKPKLDVKGLRK